MRRFAPLLALLWTMPTVLCASSQAQKIVLGMEGRWWDSGGHPISFGSQVTGQCVYGESGLLQVVDSKSNQVQVFAYDKMPADCPVRGSAKTSSVPATTRGSATELPEMPADAPRPTLTRGLSAYLDLLFRKPQMYVVAAARGLEEEPQESVLLLSDGEVELAPALQTISPGKYLISLEPIDTGKPDRAESGKISWAQGTLAKIRLVRNGPGLYRLNVAQEGGDSEGAESWVLVAAPARYQSDAKEFDEVVSMTKSWGDRVDSPGKRALLRACLQSLADRKVGK